MKLAGDLAEFSLADLVQVSGVAGRTCCVKVMTAGGNGALYLEAGEVVSAAYEDLTGFEALVALVAARAGHFEVENDAAPPRPTMSGKVQNLLIEANARIVAGKVPTPRRQAPAAPRATALPETAAMLAPIATAAGGSDRFAGDRRGRGLWIGGVAALALLGAAGWLTFARGDAAARGGSGGGDPNRPAAAAPALPATAEAAASPAAAALEVTQLTGPGDAKPALLSGQPPAAPDSSSGLKPTIVCRLLIGADGRVIEAKIYRSRLDLGSFEDAALDAVRGYRFSPGRHAGAPVPVWINWPVAFR